MRQYIGFAVGALALAPALTAQALTANLREQAVVSERTIVTQGGPGGPTAPGNPDNPRYDAPFGRFAGVNNVVSLRIVTGIGTFGCTGTLLNNRTQILTAAHCITDGSADVIATRIDVRFQRADGSFETISVNNPGALAAPANMQVKPGYTGDVIDGRDLAVLTMPTAAPAFANGASIFNGNFGAIAGRQVTFAGYGSTGTGTTGDLQPGFADRRRFGFNRFDAACASDGSGCGLSAGSVLLADFDNGSPAGGYNGDAICRLFGSPTSPPFAADQVAQVCNRGVTSDLLDEVGIGRGDSGGAAWFNGLIVGVASFGSRIDGTFPFGGWGTIAGYASAMDAENRAWLMTVAPGSVVPEPSTYALMATGLAGLAAIARRRRTPKA